MMADTPADASSPRKMNGPDFTTANGEIPNGSAAAIGMMADTSTDPSSSRKMNGPDFKTAHGEIPNGSAAAVGMMADTPAGPSSSRTMNGPGFTTAIARRKNKKKKQTLVSDTASSASSNNCGSTTSSTQKGIKIFRNPNRIRVGSVTKTRKSVAYSDVEALGLTLGMSFAAVAQVLERKNAAGEMISGDYLSGICIWAVRESLGNVFGDKFDGFVTNFEKSCRGMLMTLRSISDGSQKVGEQQQRNGGSSCSISNNLLSGNLDDCACHELTDGLESLPHRNSSGSAENQDSSFGLTSTVPFLDRIKDLAYPSDGTEVLESLLHRNSTEEHERAENQDLPFGLASILASLDRIEDSRQCNTHAQSEENVNVDLINQQLVLLDKQIEQHCASASTRSSNSVISTIEKSVMEQRRLNVLKTFKIGLMAKDLQLREREVELKSKANFLQRGKLLMGVSKASLRAEMFKTKLQDSRHVELLKKCLDLLVAGIIIMLSSLAYGTYVYSHQRIIAATEACSPYTESKSWWMPKSVSSFNSGLQFLKCQIQVFSRMFFGVLMIIAIVVLLIQRSSTSQHAMPVTFILLLLGVACGCAGKFCIDTLGGSGNHWLICWEALCLLHFLAYVFRSILFDILHGPITVAQRVEPNTVFPYWMRRVLFYGTSLFIPLLCGFMPFATPWEWFDHFLGRASDFITFVDD
ncbi:hypothetical protein CDL12_15363 [Handroanthus impetiginosus]|uniref:Protein CPR-5 n=1 Tax=Handroanthus impetiginosus TaxID=429701 RepID=A0A2G9H3D1_9LAMI|nr:hypothetical protein CDL12_15363 [Handroanthus impetiginosus]